MKHKTKATVVSLIIFTILFLVPTVAAEITPEFVFRQGTNSDLKFYCWDEKIEQPCDESFICNITIQNPDQTLFVDNGQASRQSSYYNYSLPSTDTFGFYQYQTFCFNGTNGGFSDELYFLINSSGELLDTSKSILYVFALILVSGIFGLCLFGAIKIPWQNKKRDDGTIVEMNDLKYVKLFLWFVVYILAIFITYMAHTTTAMLEMNLTTKVFNFMFWFLIVFLAPAAILTVTAAFVRFWADKKIYNLIGRNVRAR